MSETVKTFAQDPRPERLRLVGNLPRRNGDSPAILVRFDAKPTMNPDGTIHYPLSQQVEPEWATCVKSNSRCLERIPEGARLLVKCHMNGDRLEGTDLHWLSEDDVLGVWEDEE